MKKITLLFLLIALPMMASTELIYPWVSANDMFSSKIIINNLGSSAANVTLKAVRESGEEETVTLEVGAFGQVVASAEETFSQLGSGQGYSIFLDSEQDNIHGALVVSGRQSASGSSPAQADVLPRTGHNHLLFNFMPVAAPDISSLVLVNLSNETTQATIYTFQNGEKRHESQVELLPGQPKTLITSVAYADVDGPLYVVASADQPMVGMAFVFNDFLEPAMAAAQPLDAVPNPTIAEVSTLNLSLQIPIEQAVVTANGDILAASGPLTEKIYRITPEGEVSTLYDQIDGVAGIVTDAEGNVFALEFNKKRIIRLEQDGNHVPVAQIGEGDLGWLRGLRIGPDGRFYSTHHGTDAGGSKRIRRENDEGVMEIWVEGDPLLEPFDLAWDDQGNAYVTSVEKTEITMIAPDGTATLWATLPFFMTQIMHHKGKLYVAAGTLGIYEINLSDKSHALYVAGTSDVNTYQDGPIDEASLFLPGGMAKSPDGSFMYSHRRNKSQTFLSRIPLP